MKTIVVFWLKNEPKMTKAFKTLSEAEAFMMALSVNPECESYGIVR